MHTFTLCVIIIIHAAEGDYYAQNLSVIFGPDDFEKSIRVPIINDTFREKSEIFYGKLSVNVPGQPMVTTIKILYSDCK